MPAAKQIALIASIFETAQMDTSVSLQVVGEDYSVLIHVKGKGHKERAMTYANAVHGPRDAMDAILAIASAQLSCKTSAAGDQFMATIVEAARK